MNYYEKMRLEISIHMTKRDLKKRGREINPESRSVLRKEFGEWINKSSFEEDELLFQSIYRFEFDDSGILIEQAFLNADNFNKIAFSSDETKVERDAYGITDQLYDAFTRGQ